MLLFKDDVGVCLHLQFAKGHEDSPCVVYLFPEWVLDTAGKFAGACIGTFLMGLVVGLLGKVRSQLKTAWEAEGCWQPGYRPQWRAWLADAVIISIVAVQVCLGYFVMLVAMTYQAELFLMVVLGLAFGHLFYRPSVGARSSSGALKQHVGSSHEPKEQLEPCCSA